MSETEKSTTKIVVVNEKSMVIALLLTFFFGPLGLLYASITGGLVMIALTVVVFVISFGLLTLVTWPVCMIWAAIAVSGYNGKLRASAS